MLLNCHPDEKKINRHLVLICFNGLKVNLLQPKKPHFEAGVFSPADSNLSGEKAAPALPMTTAKPGGGRAEKVLSPEQLASLKAEVASAAKGSAAEKKKAKMEEKEKLGKDEKKEVEKKGEKLKPFGRGVAARLAAQKVLASLVTHSGSSGSKKTKGESEMKSKGKGRGRGRGKGNVKKTATKRKGKGGGKGSEKAGSTKTMMMSKTNVSNQDLHHSTSNSCKLCQS